MPPREGRDGALAAVLAALLAASAAGAISLATQPAVSVCGPGSGSPSPIPAPSTTTPIRHIFILIKENHAFENYFGTLPGVVGFPPNGTFPLSFQPGASTVHPFPLPGSSTTDLPHDHRSETVEVNGGSMNLFVAEAAAGGAQDPLAAVGHYTEAQIPPYFAYAHAYALGDEFFSGYLGPTLPNRIFDLAATTAGVSGDTPPAEPLTVPTLLDQLTAARIPWAYDYTGSPVNLTPLLFASIAGSPCVARSVVPFADLSAQLESNTPPAVTFIDPSHGALGVSEHPPDNVTVGADWSAGIVNAIFTSPLASDSAVFLFYDEAGGYWDPVAPPPRGDGGDGIRIPFLVLSPYTPSGLLVHETLDPASVLGFVDQDFGLAPLNARVAAAPPLAPFFAFTAPPRPPLLVPTPFNFSATKSTMAAPPTRLAGANGLTSVDARELLPRAEDSRATRGGGSGPKPINHRSALRSTCPIAGSRSAGRSRCSSSLAGRSSRSR